jgi:hypothetical protein
VLRLIHSRERPAWQGLQHAALVGLEVELAVYVERSLREHWPAIGIQWASDLAEVHASLAQLVICGTEPLSESTLPTLWLSALERQCHPFRVCDRLWKCAMPISGKQLVRAVERIVIEAEPMRLKSRT